MPRTKPTMSLPTSACRRRFCSHHSIGTTSSTSASAPKKARMVSWPSRFPWATKSCRRYLREDIGKCAYGIFKSGGEYIGKTVGIAGEHLTGSEFASALSRALGREVKYNNVSPDIYRSFGFPGAEDMGNMFQFKRDFEQAYCSARSVEFSRKLNSELQSFETWLKTNAGRIPLEE